MTIDRATLSPLAEPEKQAFQQNFIDQATSSYLLLSFGMGLVAATLPLALLIVGPYEGHYSISNFYYASDLTRNLMVGFLWATCVFLFLFHGLSKLENWLLNAAGVFGIGIAMVPMGLPQCGGPNDGITVHGSFALAFFITLAFVAVVLSKGRVKYIPDEKLRRRFTLAYNLCGFAMIAMPATVTSIHFLSRAGCESHWIFWFEALGIWAFAAFWFIKTLEYRLLLGVKVKAP